MTPRGAGTQVPLLSEAGVLAALPPAARDALLAKGTDRRYARDEVLFTANTPAHALYLVLEGRVRVLRPGGGRPFVLHDAGPGGTLGEVPMFEQLGDAEPASYPATAVAAEPTRCLCIGRSELQRLVRQEPEIALLLLSRLARRVRLLVERMDDRVAHSTEARLVGLLLARDAAAQGRSFLLGRSQAEAAEEIGTVREVVVRGLRALRARGLIRAVGGGRYVVCDRDALLQRASAGE